MMVWLYIGLAWAAINILAVWCGVRWQQGKHNDRHRGRSP